MELSKYVPLKASMFSIKVGSKLDFLKNKKICLASNSPRRSEIFEKMGLNFTKNASNFKENLKKGDFKSHSDYCLSTAIGKANASLHLMKNYDLLVACDTIISFRGRIIEKPCDIDEARDTLEDLNDDIHEVFTAVVLLIKSGTPPRVRQESFVDQTSVSFCLTEEEDIEDYLKTGEYEGKAGAYAIQAGGAALVHGIVGDYHNVVGFPVAKFLKQVPKYFK